MFKVILEEVTQNPPSFGGNWECDTGRGVGFSKSIKEATRLAKENMTGGRFCPIMDHKTIERDGKVIYDVWD